jgi:hypothetical protein
MALWPDGKKFAFTIIDDTDNATVSNVGPVYALLSNLGLKTTKTVWCYPSRSQFSAQCLEDSLYLSFIKDLYAKGFEIASHGVGCGSFTREEIIRGIELFKDLLGFYPTMHINHSHNPDNIYWGSERYGPLLQNLIGTLYGKKRMFYGHDPDSEYFWGDVCKKHIRYIRNRVFMGANTLGYDPLMPYKEKKKDFYTNYWFSSSDGHTVEEFTQLLSKRNVDSLIERAGACIVYTHFSSGFVDKQGHVNQRFKERLEYLASQGGWFVPASEVLDYLKEQKNNTNEYVSQEYLFKQDLIWLLERVYKKIFFRR